MTDREFVEQIHSGDAAAFEQLFRSQYAGLFRFLLHILKSTDVSEELAQELFTRIWTRRREFNPTGKLEPYLFKMANNLALDYLRHQRIVQIKEEEIVDELLSGTKTAEEDFDEKMLLEELEKGNSGTSGTVPPHLHHEPL